MSDQMPHPPDWIWPPARDLDVTAHAVASDWGLSLGLRFAGARYSFCAPADGHVLKIRPPEDDESDHEPDALRLWDGHGAIRLLREDPERRAMLIERAVPGDDASKLPDDESLAIAIAVGRQIWRPADRQQFKKAGSEVRRWLSRVADTGHPFVPVAERTFARMDIREDVLVHGDFHHHNLLRHGDHWVVIDPKPLIAEPEFDVVTLLWNPIGFVVTRETTERRIRALTQRGLNGTRIRDWAIVRGTYLGLPLGPGEDEAEVPQLRAVRALV